MGELRKMVEQHYDNIARANSDGEDEIFSPNVVTVVPGGGKLEGIAAFKAYEQAFHRAFPDGQVVLKSAVESGNVIATEGAFVGTQTGAMSTPAGEIPPTYRKLDLPFGDFFQVENGRVVQHHVYYDQVAFMTQLGLMPAPASA